MIKHLEAERRLARERVAGYRRRFRDADESFFPLQIAIAWSNALDEQPPDVARLKGIAATALQRQEEFEIAFFTFCNEMERFCQDL